MPEVTEEAGEAAGVVRFGVLWLHVELNFASCVIAKLAASKTSWLVKSSSSSSS